MQGGTLVLSPGEVAVIDIIQRMLDWMFWRPKPPPEGMVAMKQAIVELEESTSELKHKLEHPPEIIAEGYEPIRDHMFPLNVDRRVR